MNVFVHRCWDKDSKVRPTMSEIVEHMKFITRFFPKGDDPLVFPDGDGSVATDECALVSLIF